MQEEHPLRTWRKASKPKVTLTELAGRVGVTPSHLSEIERGLNGVSLDLARRISHATAGAVSNDAFAERAA